MESQKYLNSESTQKNILIGIIIILIAGIVSLSVLLNIQFNYKISQIENAASFNAKRLAYISNFLAKMDQEIKKKKSQAKMINDMSQMSISPSESE
jgi:prefoldin subunit 5